jgi:ribA/ribD-fused uncharacterized protein
MPQSRRQLLRRDGFIFFWGEFLSNWERSPMVIDGVIYSCVEQYMMAEKARTFGDEKTLAKIMAATDPSDQKRYGRQAGPYNEEKWAARRYGVVLRATLEKYRQNPHLMELLMATGTTDVFVEASPTDRIWGIGMRRSDPNLMDQSRWGQNLLGKAITEARDILVRERSTI